MLAAPEPGPILLVAAVAGKSSLTARAVAQAPQREAQWSATGCAGSRRHWLLVLAIDHGPWTVVGVGVWHAQMVFVATASVATMSLVCSVLVVFSFVFLSR